ncbi:LCP family protein [Bacillus sp. FJAT-27445]|uniref:LCP family protein n=1 Tax=Bacillus sp. FJAT-27445 TaxID=1679166 RepID=UPI000743525F|nr:LCP family protein [Bacillus sp. FJAT-27445]
MENTRLKRKKIRKKRTFRIIALLIAFLVIGTVSFFAYEILYSTQKASKNIYHQLESDKKAPDVAVTKDPFTVLLVGIESQEGGERSDVLMLATVNPKTEKIYMVSIPRDTRLYIDEVGYKTKITHSYGNGGIETTIKAVKSLIDVPIDYYITTNFDGFEDVVDTLSGVKVDVPFTFKAQLTGSLKWKTYYQGEMELNGNEALAYVRMRKTDPRGDHGRNERQQQVIKAIIDKGTSFTSITKIDNLIDDMGKNVKTNIPPSKFASFVKLYSKLKNTPIENLKIEGEDRTINNGAYFIPDEESLAQINTLLTQALGDGTGSSSSLAGSSSANSAAAAGLDDGEYSGNE